MTALRLVFAATLALALTGCGKTAPVEVLAPIDTQFGKQAAAGAKLQIGTSIQEREDGEVDAPETTRVGGPSNEKKGFRND